MVDIEKIKQAYRAIFDFSITEPVATLTEEELSTIKEEFTKLIEDATGKELSELNNYVVDDQEIRNQLAIRAYDILARSIRADKFRDIIMQVLDISHNDSKDGTKASYIAGVDFGNNPMLSTLFIWGLGAARITTDGEFRVGPTQWLNINAKPFGKLDNHNDFQSEPTIIHNVVIQPEGNYLIFANYFDILKHHKQAQNYLELYQERIFNIKQDEGTIGIFAKEGLEFPDATKGYTLLELIEFGYLKDAILNITAVQDNGITLEQAGKALKALKQVFGDGVKDGDYRKLIKSFYYTNENGDTVNNYNPEDAKRSLEESNFDKGMKVELLPKFNNIVTLWTRDYNHSIAGLPELIQKILADFIHPGNEVTRNNPAETIAVTTLTPRGGHDIAG